MISYVVNPNLPSGKVNKIVCGTNDKKILDFFAENGIEVLKVEANTEIDPSVSTHADMSVLHFGGNKIIVDKAQSSLESSLKDIGFEVCETKKEIKGKYPDDIKLNFAVVGDFLIGNMKCADSMLSELINDKKQLNVRQGYSKCSTLVVNEGAIVTDDEGIYRKTTENGFDSLLISKGDIYLPGHEYGFIGGASGKISDNTVVFFGDIIYHCDFDKISSFLAKHGCNYLCTDKGQLRDIGGIIPLTQI